MTSYVILGVCSANVQRSPTCEAVLNYALREKEAPSPLDISSAGINVKDILENKVALFRMVAMIDAGLNYGLVRDDKRRIAEEIVHKYSSEQHNPVDDDASSISALYAEVRPLVHGMLTAFRNIALQRAGVPEQFVPHIYRPFPIGSHLDVVLALDDVVQDKVNRVMIDQPACRVITYGTLVQQPPLKDNLKGGIDEAVKQVEYFMDTRNRALNEIFILLPSNT